MKKLEPREASRLATWAMAKKRGLSLPVVEIEAIAKSLDVNIRAAWRLVRRSGVLTVRCGNLRVIPRSELKRLRLRR